MYAAFASVYVSNNVTVNRRNDDIHRNAHVHSFGNEKKYVPVTNTKTKVTGGKEASQVKTSKTSTAFVVTTPFRTDDLYIISKLPY